MTPWQDDMVDVALRDIKYTIASKYTKNVHKAKFQKQSKQIYMINKYSSQWQVNYQQVTTMWKVLRHRGTFFFFVLIN